LIAPEHATGIEEKAAACPLELGRYGLYFYDIGWSISCGADAVRRGEIEITDVNRAYLDADELHVERLGRAMPGSIRDARVAAGSCRILSGPSSIARASRSPAWRRFVWRKGFIGTPELLALAARFDKNGYGAYLRV